MKKEYLEDYTQRESFEHQCLIAKIRDGKFRFGEETYPPPERFVKLNKPVAIVSRDHSDPINLWSQIPFCGSLVIFLSPVSMTDFEQNYFKISEIPEVIDLVKKTGRLQIGLTANPMYYEGLEFLEPIFTELNPPCLFGFSPRYMATEKELNRIRARFDALARVNYIRYLRQLTDSWDSRYFRVLLEKSHEVYELLTLGGFRIAEDIENLMVDGPAQAYGMMDLCQRFITTPRVDLLSGLYNYSISEVKTSTVMPGGHLPTKMRFACEIGKFLVKKLTFAAEGLRSCERLIDEYDSYDLHILLESMHQAIVLEHPDILQKKANELSQILDSLWNDPTIPRRIKGLKFGIPLSMAALGNVVAGPVGAAGGLLAGLGFDVLSEFISVETECLSEVLAKVLAKSYQVNIYDFKSKYRFRIARTK